MEWKLRSLMSGDEAVACAAHDLGVALGVGYPGTPSTEILEAFADCGDRAEWAPNEKVALEVAIGAAFGGARTLCTMKHVGVNVAADPLFTVAYTGVDGALVLVSADDPGLASSQNEQDNRHYAVAAQVPMFEPADSQESYDLFVEAMLLSERTGAPVLFRMTTRVCHAKTIVTRRADLPRPPATGFRRDIPRRVMIPAYARPAHAGLRKRMADIAQWNESAACNTVRAGSKELGLIVSGISAMHAMEAAPDASVLKLGMTWPLPVEKIAAFAQSVTRCLVIDEGDHWLADRIRAEGITVESKPDMYRHGELDVRRVRRILAGDVTPEPAPAKGKPPALCPGCPHRTVFTALNELGCTVSGDIGCYTLGVLPPFEAIDTCVCMGASIGVGLGLRHVLPEAQAKKVVSVIGDSTFMHSGLTGLVEMVYNRPKTGHLVILLDNSTTAMTGLQEHPGTGRALNHEPAQAVDSAALARAVGVETVETVDMTPTDDRVKPLIQSLLESGKTCLLIVRRPCILALKKIKSYESAAQA